jgi:hypothetical protein
MNTIISTTILNNQEKQGQLEISNSPKLPTMYDNVYPPIDSKPQLEKMGIKVLKKSIDDDLFYDIELPDGWYFKPTEHALYTELLDDKKRLRAVIFYKAVSYDRKSAITFATCYRVVTSRTNDSYTAYATNNNRTVFTNTIYRKEKIKYEDSLIACKEDSLIACKNVKNFLNERFPDWRDINAYWDEE